MKINNTYDNLKKYFFNSKTQNQNSTPEISSENRKENINPAILTNSIWLKILSYLDPFIGIQLLKNLTLVSKDFHSLANNNQLWYALWKEKDKVEKYSYYDYWVLFRHCYQGDQPPPFIYTSEDYSESDNYKKKCLGPGNYCSLE